MFRRLGASFRRWGQARWNGDLEVSGYFAAGLGSSSRSDAPTTMDDMVVGGLATDDHGICVLATRYARIGATDTSATEDQYWHFDLQTGRCSLFTAGTKRFQFDASNLYANASTTELGAPTKPWGDVHSLALATKTSTGFAETARKVRTVALRSTDGSNNDTTVASLTANGQHLKVEVYVTGQEESTANILSQTIRQSFYRDSGTVSAVAAHEDDTQSNGVVAGWAVDLVVSGNNVILRLVGAAATNIRWAGMHTHQVGGTNAS